MTAKYSHNQILAILATVVVAMFALSFASVPLYNLFCKVTGFGGTPGQVEGAFVVKPGNKTFTVRFNADINQDLDWDFYPAQKEVAVKSGERLLVSYVAKNLDTRNPVKGMAIYNVTPLKVGPYFLKIQCFCFDEQVLQPGQEVHMPISFYIDPEIENDPNVSDVNTITLSYTFFAAEE